MEKQKEINQNLMDLEKSIQALARKIKNIAKKNGFSKKLKDKVEIEL